MLTSTLVASESLAFSAVHHHQLSGHPHLHHWHSNLPRCTTDAAAFHARVERGGGGDLGCFQKKTEPRKNALQQYSHWVDTKPLLTKSLTAGIVAALADIATQAVVLKMPKVSIQRVVAFLLTGTFFVGPYLHVWYTLLDKICASQQSHKLRTLLKMGLDQSIGVSIFFPMYFTTYEVATALVHGRCK